jgi:hypothetical protein
MAKIRNGFVSNSSSSSFMIYGGDINVNENEQELYNKICEGKNEEELVKLNKYLKDEDGNFDFSELIEYAEELVPKGHDMHYGGYDRDDVCVGVEPSDQEDDQTHGEWKKQIKDDLTKAFGDCVSGFGWKEDCRMDT